MLSVHCFRGCCKSKTHMYDKYGQDGSWALVTGGSDGIGLEMCHQLAAQGFNILMVARNEKKMQTRLEEIKAACGKPIECDYIVCDFSNYTKISDYRNILGPKISGDGKDIGVAILNAGYAEPNKIEHNSDDYLETTMNTNALHVYYVAKILSEKLLVREKRSALIVTSSLAAMAPIPASVAYSCQKVFVTYLARGMSMEMSHKIDVMSYNPGEVATKLIMKDKS